LEEWNVLCEVRRFISGKELLQTSEQFDIIFLDIIMPEPFWYLVKPVEDWRLRKVLKQAIEKIRRQPREFLAITSERQKKKVFLADICYFEIRGRMICAHQSEEVFCFYEQIGALEQQLQGKGFFRCHKSYLVNLGRVRGYNRQEATLDDGGKIIIAKRRYEAFCQALLEYMKENGDIL